MNARTAPFLGDIVVEIAGMQLDFEQMLVIGIVLFIVLWALIANWSSLFGGVKVMEEVVEVVEEAPKGNVRTDSFNQRNLKPWEREKWARDIDNVKKGRGK